MQLATHILLIEDNPGDARLLREVLGEAALFRHEVSHVDRLKLGLERLATGAIDVILLDLTLPDARGLDGLRRIQASFPLVPIVVLTGINDEARALEAMQAGAQDYLVKGEVDSRLIAKAIRYAVERGRAEEVKRKLDRAQTAHATASSERARLRSLFMQAPVAICVLTGTTLTFELANPSFLKIVGKVEVVGATLGEALPALTGPGFEGMLAMATTGEPYAGKEIPCVLVRDGRDVQVHLDVVCEPMRDVDGVLEGIMAVVSDVTEQVLARQRVEQAIDEQRLAIRSRDDLLATVSHDLRNPLSSISLAVELLRPTLGAADARSRKQIDVIDRSATRMEQLIRDLLDMASIESGHLSVEPMPLVAGDLVAEAVEMIQPLAMAKTLRVETDLAGVQLPVHGDRSRMLQVFSNILGNALKFTPPAGTITVMARVMTRVGARADDQMFQMVEFSVSDTGPGIEPEQLPFVFDRFWQAKETAKAGTGLGLAICKGIVQQHGGSIWVESRLGHGTTFYFTLPASRDGVTRT